MHLFEKGKKHTFLDFYNYESDVHEIINRIKSTINKGNCSHLIINIAMLNFMDATRVCILSSTYHFSLYPNGKILWIIKDKQTLQTINMFKIKNIETKIFDESLLLKPINDYQSNSFREALAVD